MQEFIQYYPDAAPIIGDLYAKSMDWPEAEQVAERLAFLLPPEVKAKKAADDAKKNGEPPPESAQPPAPPPDPLMELKVQEEQLKLQELQIKLQQEQVRLQQEQEKLKSMQVETDLMIKKSKEDIRRMMEEIEKEDSEPARSFVDNRPSASHVSQAGVTEIPGRAGGGEVEKDSPYVVGEQGPEVFIPSQNGFVAPNAAFDPEGNGYDYQAAAEGGIKPDNTGHWPSRNPITGQILKGRKHETFPLTVAGETDAGYEIYKGDDGKYYSKKK